MSQLPINDAIDRFQANEERVDVFVNQNGYYTTNEASPRQVETLPSFLQRKDNEISSRFAAVVNRGNWATATNYAVNDIFTKDGTVYITNVAHTSGVFATDYAANKLSVYKISPEILYYIEKNRKILRRAINVKTISRALDHQELAASVLNAAPKTTSTGAIVWEPDGSGSYGACWIRDMCMSMHDNLQHFAAWEIESAFNWYKTFIELSTYEVPDHVTLSGNRHMKPGSVGEYDGFGSRAPIDGNAMFIQMAWLHFVKTGNLDLYANNKILLRNLLDIGIPYDSSTNCVYVDPNSPYVAWGFVDTIKMTGSVLFGSVLAYIAYLQLAEMAYIAGDFETASHCVIKSLSIKNGINSNLYVRDGSQGMFKASTGLCSGQLDVWGSALAVYCGIAEDGTAQEISQKFAANFYLTTNGKPQMMFKGGIRHVLRSNDYINNAQCWEASYVALTYDSYQSGAYWTTPVAWVAYTLSLTRPDIVSDLVVNLKAEYNREKLFLTNTAPAEWWDYNLNIGVKIYCTSAASILCIDENWLEPYAAFSLLTISQSADFAALQYSKIPFDTKIVNSFGTWDSESGHFVIPETGFYRIEAYVRLNQLSADGEFTLRLMEQPPVGEKIKGPVLFNGNGKAGQFLTPGGSTVVYYEKGLGISVSLYCSSTASTEFAVDSAVHSWTRFSISPIAANKQGFYVF